MTYFLFRQTNNINNINNCRLQSYYNTYTLLHFQSKSYNIHSILDVFNIFVVLTSLTCYFDVKMSSPLDTCSLQHNQTFVCQCFFQLFQCSINLFLSYHSYCFVSWRVANINNLLIIFRTFSMCTQITYILLFNYYK